MTLLQFVGVRFAYGETAVLSGVDFSIAAGDVVALLGRNGAGKTTATRLAVALAHPQRGEVRVAGATTRNRQPEDIAGRAAYLFQHPDRQLFARRALDEVVFGPIQLGRPRTDALARARSALHAVGLEGHEDTHPHDLSPTDRKLLALAAALAQTGDLLVLDEPTQGFDRPARDLVGAGLRDHARQGGAALVVTHDLGFVADRCDRALVLHDGRVAYDGSVPDLVRDQERVRALGLRQPPAAQVSLALHLPGQPIRHSEVAAALVPRCRDG